MLNIVFSRDTHLPLLTLLVTCAFLFYGVGVWWRGVSIALMHPLEVSLILEYRNLGNDLSFHVQIMGGKGLLSYPFGLKMWETSKSIQKTCIWSILVLNGWKIMKHQYSPSWPWLRHFCNANISMLKRDVEALISRITLHMMHQTTLMDIV